jgi:hypothetical protein
MKCSQLLGGIRALCAAAFIFGTIPALAIVTDVPVATATPLYAEEPPQPPQLSDEERQALEDKRAGTLKPGQQGALNRAEKKQETAEKFGGQRNQQKRDNNRRRGGRRR